MDPFRHCTTYDSSQLVQILEQGQHLLAISDGGKETADGTFGWVLACPVTFQTLAEGLGSAWGFPMQSHQAEAFGNAAVLLYLQKFCNNEGIDVTRSILTVGCDNKSLLDNKKTNAHLIFDSPDRDILWVIQTATNDAPFRVKHVHVRGHQDTRGKRGKNLTYAERLNIRADQLAHEAVYRPEIMADNKNPIPFPSTYPFIRGANGIVTSQELRTLRETLPEKDYIEYIQQNKAWTDYAIDEVDWYSRYSVMNTLPETTHRFVSKFTHGWLPTNGRQHRIDPRHSPACPFCSNIETHDHLLQCPGQQGWKQSTMSATKTCLTKLNTAVDLKLSILYHLQQWLNDDQPRTEHPEHHAGLGTPPYSWRLVFTGHIPRGWIEAQTKAHNRVYHSDTGGHPWSRKLAKHFIQSAFNAWEQRNKQYHQPAQPTAASSHQSATIKLRSLCEERHRLLAADQTQFDFDVDEFCRHRSARRLQRWYERYIQFFQASLKRAKQQAKMHTHDIRKYFQKKKQ